MTPSVMNNLIHTDMSEVLRIIVSNGMILYALTRIDLRERRDHEKRKQESRDYKTRKPE